MNTQELIGAAFALGLFIMWGNRRLRQGKKPPEEGRIFGVVLLIVCGVAMYAWLHSTGQLK